MMKARHGVSGDLGGGKHPEADGAEDHAGGDGRDELSPLHAHVDEDQTVGGQGAEDEEAAVPRPICVARSPVPE